MITAQSISASSAGLQTKVINLTYDSAVGTNTFTHDGTQSTSSAGIYIADLTVVKQKIGNGDALVKIYGEATYWGHDSTKVMSLPVGTLKTSFLTKKRAFRDELNVSDYIIATPSEDSISFNRDNNISGNSPFYFEFEGIGAW